MELESLSKELERFENIAAAIKLVEEKYPYPIRHESLIPNLLRISLGQKIKVMKDLDEREAFCIRNNISKAADQKYQQLLEQAVSLEKLITTEKGILYSRYEAAMSKSGALRMEQEQLRRKP